jgi:hypothetical protein
MTPVTRTSSIANKVQPNHELKLRLLELLGDRRPTLFQNQTKEFSRLPLNPSTPCSYIINDANIHVNDCTPYTYIKDQVEFSLNHLTPYTYTADCDRCAINSRQSQNLQYLYRTQKTPPNPSPASLRGRRLSKPTLSFKLPPVAATSPHTSTPVSDASPYHPPKGSKPHSSNPPVHLEFW